ncbi:MAG: acyltransferase [Micrococcus sp.]|nr:acyltransferase [Micrococcus sp.]
MDALRLVSVAAVVLGHAYLSELTFTAYLEIWRMPLFFFLTGYFWTRNRPFGPDVRSRWISLGIPYLVWAVLMSAAAWRWTRDNPERFWELLRSGWYGGADQEPPWWAFWFIAVLFFTVVLRRFLERFPSWVAWVVAGLGLTLSHVIPDSGLARTVLGVGLALPCLFFVLAGELFRWKVQPRITRHRTAIGLSWIVVGLGAVWLGLAPHNIKFGGFGTPVLTPLVGVLIAAGMVLVFSAAVNRGFQMLAERTGAGRAIRFTISTLVRTGTVVVLAHGQILMEIMDAGILEARDKFVLTLLISWGVGVLLLATPVSRLLTGVPQQFFLFRRRPAAHAQDRPVTRALPIVPMPSPPPR